MLLEDLLLGCDISHDHYTGTKWGPSNQLEIVGWCGKRGTSKYHIFKCSICSLDTELFGDGHFKSRISEMNKGCIPCGCSHITKWSKAQYEILLHRKCFNMGITFKGIILPFLGAKTYCALECADHGEYKIGRAHV